jgi:hypothetical protein
MSRLDDKMAQCQHAILELAELRKHQDRFLFEYHFCAYIGFAGAIDYYVERLLGKKPPTGAETWLAGLRADVNVATVIGLRNSDVHDVQSKVLHLHENINVTISAGYSVQTQLGVLDVQVTNPKTGEVTCSSSTVQPAPSPPPPPPPPTIEFLYTLDPPSDFMVDRNGPLQMKKAVHAHLKSADLALIATTSYATIETATKVARGQPWGTVLV